MKETTLLIMSALASWLAPIAPVLGVFAILVCADVVTAYMLNRRVRGTQARLSSQRLGKAVRTFGYAAMVVVLCHAIDTWVTPGNIAGIAASYMCFQQMVSILENISSCNDAPWARMLQRFLADKTQRH